MRRNILKFILILLAPPAFADSLITGPQACAAVNIAQSERLEWRESGLFNRDPNRSLFVVCPFTRGLLDERFTGEVRVLNDANTPAQIECVFREFDLRGRQQRGTRRSVDLGPGTSGSVLVENARLADPENYYSVTCQLPPDSAILALINDAGFASASPPDGGPGGDDGPPTGSSLNRQQTERLRGSWRFRYTILVAFENRYTLNSVQESSTTPDFWTITGTGESGDAVAAAYDPDSGSFVLLDPGSIIDRIFVFDFDSANAVSGCYVQVNPPGSDNLSRCYEMTGTRLSAKAASKAEIDQAPAALDALDAERQELLEAAAFEAAAAKAGVEAGRTFDPQRTIALRLRERLRTDH